MASTRPASGAAQLRPAVTDAITQAVLAELGKKGYARVSMEQVARTAGVGKSALYRRWPSKQAMMVDVLAQLSDSQQAPRATGDFRKDVRVLIDRMHQYIEDQAASTIMTDIIAEAMRSTEIADVVNGSLVSPRRATARSVLEQSEHGRQLSVAQKDLFMDIVFGALYWRFVQGRRTTRRDLKNLEDVVVAGFEGL